MTGPDLELPELTPERQDDIEAALFADIRAEVSRSTEQSQRRRRRAWGYTGAAAAVIVVAGFVGPALSGTGASSSAGGSVELYDEGAGGAVAPEANGDLGGDGGGVAEENGSTAATGSPASRWICPCTAYAPLSQSSSPAARLAATA